MSVTTRDGILRLRWTYGGARKHLSLCVPDTPENRQLAEERAAAIEADVIAGNYDLSLEKYKIIRPVVSLPQSAYTVELFDSFIAFKRASGIAGQTLSTKFRALRSNLNRYGKPITTAADALAMVQLLRNRQSPTVANQNLFLLKEFGEWAIDAGHCRENLFKPIRSVKGTSRKVQDRTPFSREELARFLEVMRDHPTASHYYDFTVVLFQLGLRPSEAIGLRWLHLNLGRREVTISESLSRAADGRSSGAARERKGTKTETSRILPLNDRLIEIFTRRWSLATDPDSLIFLAPGGGAIDDRNYRNRCWKVVCEAAGVRYRPPYTSRHTLISYGLEFGGWTERQAAAIAGHKDTRMISQTYGHLMQKPELPDLNAP